MNHSLQIKSLILTLLLIFSFGCSEANNESKPASSSKEGEQVSAEGNSTTDVNSDEISQVRATILQQLGPVPIDRISKSPMPGIYEVLAQGQAIYVSADQKFLFPGPLLSIRNGELVNLTVESQRQLDNEKAPERAELMASIDPADFVIFKSDSEKYVVNVFTDVDCAYCRKLHQNMADYNDKGITIRYLAFPRAGVNSKSYNKLVSVWCAEDRQSAMNDAKLRNKFEPRSCDNPVADQYTMTRQLGLTGTPALILPTGELISGFLEPNKLADYLDKISSDKQGKNL